MKTYAGLDLKKIRDECGLDFARHTYSKRQCSCCYGPEDMPDQFWAKGKKPKKINKTYDKYGLRTWNWNRNLDEISYILFKNANNGSGYIKSLDEPVKNYTCIGYRFSSKEQKLKVCAMLQEQLGNEYHVEIPDDDYKCIIIWTIEKWKEHNR